MEGTLPLILRQTSCTFETCANKSKTSSWLSIVKSEKDQHGKLYNIAIWTKTNCTRKVCEIDSGSWQRWLGWWRWRMIICKRPILLNDHLQEAGPSRWSFAIGQSLQMIICKRPVPLDDHLQEAGPSRWSFARGRPLRMFSCKGLIPPDDQLQGAGPYRWSFSR